MGDLKHMTFSEYEKSLPEIEIIGRKPIFKRIRYYATLMYANHFVDSIARGLKLGLYKNGISNHHGKGFIHPSDNKLEKLCLEV